MVIITCGEGMGLGKPPLGGWWLVELRCVSAWPGWWKTVLSPHEASENHPLCSRAAAKVTMDT
jgi:hypothetical protein